MLRCSEGMVQDIEDIDAVINQFLDFARVTGEAGSGGELDLNELVHSVRRPLRAPGQTGIRAHQPGSRA